MPSARDRLRRGLGAAVAALIVVALGEACGEAEPGPTAQKIPEEQIAEVCSSYAAAWCALENRCIVAPHLRRTDCSEEALQCRMALRVPGAELARRERCVSALEGMTCDDWDVDRLPEDCRTVPGPGADGAPCLVDAHCASARCDHQGPHPEYGTLDTYRCGRCAPRHGLEGEPCPCAPGRGLHCDWSGTTMTCTTRWPEVCDPCPHLVECKRRETCSGERCTVPPKEGDACPSDAAAAFYCGPTLACDAGTCVPSTTECLCPPDHVRVITFGPECICEPSHVGAACSMSRGRGILCLAHQACVDAERRFISYPPGGAGTCMLLPEPSLERCVAAAAADGGSKP